MGNENAEDCIGKHGYGTRNEEDSRIVEMAQAFRLAIVNTYYTKKGKQIIAYTSGNKRTQINYILCQRDQVKNVIDCKTLPRENVAEQHRPVLCKVKVKSDLKVKEKAMKKTKWWKLKEAETRREFIQVKDTIYQEDKDWNTVTTKLRTVATQVLGESPRNKKEGKEAWWWNSEIQEAVKLMRECKKARDRDRQDEELRKRLKVANKQLKK
ncbi:uncharacterized protein LOC134786232 [Penaeus indicus]|uniref:uncharacterized protein LOC134786232 n=1 Tax=Penaeus indicus TaxID=29960 RepID=UPI00300D2917